MNITYKTTIVASFLSVLSAASWADNNAASAAQVSLPASNKNPVGVPAQFNIAPTPEILNAVKQAMGGVSVNEAAQADNAVKMYDHARQIEADAQPITDTYPVKLHSGHRYTVKVVSGYESEIAFFDLNGQPWNVGSTSTGNKKILLATKSEIMPHSITLAAAENRYAGRTNLKVRFEGLETSITFPIEINTQSYHETLKVVLPGSSPNTKANQHSSYEERYAMDDDIGRAILDNPINPETAVKCDKRLAVAETITGQTILGIQPAVFQCESGLYLRTRFLTGASPEPNGVTYGPDGYRVYRFIDAGEIFAFRDKTGRSVFIEAIKPQRLIGARFGEQVRLK